MTSNQQPADSALKQFRAIAVIDWLDVEIRTERRTQHWHVRTALKEITGIDSWWAGAIDMQPGDVTDTYSIRFHDELANNHQRLCAVLDALARRFPFAAEPTIAGIEISCDFWHKQQSVEATRTLTYRLQTSLFVPGGHARQHSDESKVNRFLNKPGDRIKPEDNLRFGDKHDPISWHCYHKRTDHNRQPLPIDQQRARVEVTLQGAALQQHGFGPLSGLPHFRFETLAKLFIFRRPIPSEVMHKNNPFEQRLMAWVRAYRDITATRGLQTFRKIGIRDKKGRTRAESSHLTADKELSNRVRAALRNLHP